MISESLLERKLPVKDAGNRDDQTKMVQILDLRAKKPLFHAYFKNQELRETLMPRLGTIERLYLSVEDTKWVDPTLLADLLDQPHTITVSCDGAMTEEDEAWVLESAQQHRRFRKAVKFMERFNVSHFHDCWVPVLARAFSFFIELEAAIRLATAGNNTLRGHGGQYLLPSTIHVDVSNVRCLARHGMHPRRLDPTHPMDKPFSDVFLSGFEKALSVRENPPIRVDLVYKGQKLRRLGVFW